VFVRGYNIMEKIQMSGFFIQETLLSSIYIFEAVRLLRTSLRPNARNLMYQLFLINFIIISMDLGLLGLECASLYVIQVSVKPMVYSIKLKLEFAVLGRLVKFVSCNSANNTGSGGSQSRRSSTMPFMSEKRKESRRGDGDISDFVDIERLSCDVTHAAPFPPRLPMNHTSASDTDLVIGRLPSGLPSVPAVTFQDIDLCGPKNEEEPTF
jgi:hypothetical protein